MPGLLLRSITTSNSPPGADSTLFDEKWSLPVKSSGITEILYVGIIFALSKSNNYMKELFGGISTNVNMQISKLK